MKQWLAEHPTVVIAALITVGAVLAVALLVGVDLSWIPQFLRDALGL